MRGFLSSSLAVVLALAGLAVFVDSRQDDVPLKARIFDVAVEHVGLGYDAKRVGPVYLFDGRTAVVQARVENIERVEVMVVINSRTNFGVFEGVPDARGRIAIEVELPQPGSLLTAPGPGVRSLPQTFPARADQVYGLIITGHPVEGATPTNLWNSDGMARYEEGVLVARAP